MKDYYLCQDNLIDACRDSDLILLGVYHDEFKNLPFAKISYVMNGNIILDTRNCLNQEELKQYGLICKLLGKE